MASTKLNNTKIKVNFGFLSIETNWEIDEIQKKAAWEMYVELATRVTTAKLQKGDGLLREALSSLYSLFETTRGILKKYGPSIATPYNPEDTTFGHLAVNILNKVVRPILAKWHPLLLDWEHKKPSDVSSTVHETNWVYNEELRNEINEVRRQLIEYGNLLGLVSGVANLIEAP